MIYYANAPNAIIFYICDDILHEFMNFENLFLTS